MLSEDDDKQAQQLEEKRRKPESIKKVRQSNKLRE